MKKNLYNRVIFLSVGIFILGVNLSFADTSKLQTCQDIWIDDCPNTLIPSALIESNKQDPAIVSYLENGHGRFFPSGWMNMDWHHQLLGAEQKSRNANLGGWAGGRFIVHPTTSPETLMSFKNKFVIAEGQVTDVAEFSEWSYINFGQDWRSDFTIRVGKHHRTAIRQEHGKLTELVGQKVMIRGLLQSLNGPMIELSHPAQLRIINDKKINEKE